MAYTFVMAGGGTGGHVLPLLAVARRLRVRGHRAVFIGTRRGMEAKLVPAENFPIEWIEIGGLKRVGLRRTLQTAAELPLSIWHASHVLDREKPAAVFSMGGFAAGPVLLAALWKRVPVVLMEPNAVPGFTHRKLARFAALALINFPETGAYFPPGRTELTGLPVREEFFTIPIKPRGTPVTLLITGGSQGSRTLNRAAEQSWPLWQRGPASGAAAVRIIHQTGAPMFDELAPKFRASGIRGEITAFLPDMARAFAEADIVVCRAGAGAVSEAAAAGKPSILVPLPGASDDHQLKNAEALERAGAARLVQDRDMTGERLVEEVMRLIREPGTLEAMAGAARALARPGAAQRAADVLETLALQRFAVDRPTESRNNT